MRHYTTESLGAKQHLTPEGYLVAEDVLIARTGMMLYAEGEVPIKARDGLIRIERDPADVFAPATLASFEGKPICLDHPDVDVNPSNWAQLAKGFVHNVRRGAGLDDDFLVADLLITDAYAIRQVRDGLREVSCGYDADYEELQPGQGRQMNIIGNHLALVPKGRCGSRCAIGDTEMKPPKFLDRLRAAFKSRDEAAFELALTKDADEEDETEEEKKKRLAKEKKDKEDEDEKDKKTEDAFARFNDSLKSIDARLATFESTRDAATKDAAAALALKLKEDEAAKTGDSAALATDAQDTLARAEILSPGLHMPTFDAKARKQATVDAICGMKRKALATAFDGKYKDAITPFLGASPDFKTLTCDAVASAFLSASEIVRRENNAVSTQVTFDGSKQAGVVAKSINDINAKNAAFWKRDQQ